MVALTHEGYIRLIEAKIDAARADLAADLQRRLYGRPLESNPLRQAIADAYDEVTFTQSMTATLDAYKDQITEQIFTESPILAALKKEKTMDNPTVVAMDERRVKQARKRVKRVGKYIDAFDWADGDIVRWTVVFNATGAKTYHYVALKGGNRWYITGDANPYSTNGLIGKIADLATRGLVVFEDDEDTPL